MRCDACGAEIIGRANRPEYCRDMALCDDCNGVDLVKTTEDPEEMVIMIRISKREAKKRYFNSQMKKSNK